MEKNSHILFNGSAINMSLSLFKKMKKNKQFQIPSFEKIVKSDDNLARFLSNVICIHEEEEDEGYAIITINHGGELELLNAGPNTDFYTSFTPKPYPLILEGRILINNGKSGKIDMVLTDGSNERGTTRFDIDNSERNFDTQDVHIVRSDETPGVIEIIQQKNHNLGGITPPHLGKFTKEEIDHIEKAALIDYAYSIFESWDASDEEKEKASKFLAEHLNSENPIYPNSAITGQFSIYELDIDIHALQIAKPTSIFFENIFMDNVSLAKDHPIFVEDQSDYWEGTKMETLIYDQFRISTSLLLSNIEPDKKTGKVKITVINKTINDVRSLFL